MDITIVIRSSYERTEDICHNLVKRQVPEENIVIIHERPFFSSLKRSFQTGIAADREWTLCIDADVLILPNAVEGLVGFVSGQPDACLGASGLVLDKLRMEKSRGGHHIYRTHLLIEALSIIKTDKNMAFQLRPETYLKHKMQEVGYYWSLWDEVIGLHDFEQFYSDIYRKMIVRAQKSSSAREKYLKKAALYSQKDPDFLVAAWGLRIGTTKTDRLYLDSEQWREEASSLMLAQGLEEKKVLEVPNGEKAVQELYRNYSYLMSDNKFSAIMRLFHHKMLKVKTLG